MKLSLLDKICESAGHLILVHPSLQLFAQELSVRDLARWTTRIHSESSAGKPVKPPIEFVSEVKRVVPHSAWTRLRVLLVKLVHLSGGQSEDPLSAYEQESLTMGILWETMVITECSWRSDEIQGKISTIHTVDLIPEDA